jgi:type II secretory pathway pseudopilin PulG
MQATLQTRWRGKTGGFTLLEVSIVLIIIVLIIAAGIPMGRTVIESAKVTQTNNKLDQIEQSLMAYRTAFNRLPCPADPTLPNTNINYGVEAANPGKCTGGTPAVPFTNTSGAPEAGNVVEGGVPFKVLGLPESYMYDAWGRKFAYSVNYQVTLAGSMKNQSLSDQCGITVNDAGGAARTTGALYALISYGEDGHGGYLKNGTRVNAGSTNANEQLNCHCTSSLGAVTYNYTIYNPTTSTNYTYNSTYVQMDRTEDPVTPSDLYADIVRYKTRAMMITPDDMYNKAGSVCQPGIRIDGFTSNDPMIFWQLAVGDVNGDGIPDLVIVTSYGEAVVVFGSKAGFPNPLPLNSINGTNGFIVTGLIWPYIAIGDFNGDGYADMVFGNYNPIYVLFGHASPWPAVVNISSMMNGTNGFELNGAVNEGQAATGDLNGDGIDDLYITLANGAAYVVFGHTGTWASSITLANLNGSFTVTNPMGNDGRIGDFNGDGIGDLIMCSGGSAPGRTDAKSYCAIIFGHKGAWSNPNTQTLNGSNGAYLYFAGSDANAGTACTPNSVGDVNGDGIDDMALGCPAYNASGSGAAFVVFGHTGAWSQYNALETMITNGQASRIDYGYSLGYWGFPIYIASADVNGNGIRDLVIATNANVTQYNTYGSIFVLFGQKIWPSVWNLKNTPLNGTNGFRIDCSYSGDMSGYNNLGCGSWLWTTSASKRSSDLNGDGTDDILTYQPDGVTLALSWTGTINIVYGRQPPNVFPAVLKTNTIR